VTDDISIEVPTDDDWPAMIGSLGDAFNETFEEGVADVERLAYEPERGLVARRDGEVVGTAAIFTRQLSVPGALVSAGHVTFVGVRPTARRQGVLTRFMRRQMEDMQAAGEPIAVLWASEGRIYQRFGYGSACRHIVINADSREVRITAPTGGRLREGTPTDLREAMVKVYDQVYAVRPGRSERAARHWDYRLADPPSFRRDQTPLRVLIHEGDTGVDGYALWRATSKWEVGVPAGEVRALEVVAADPVGYATLWNFLLTVDLTRRTQLRIAAMDEPLQYLVNEPRRLGLGVGDGLWLRIVDVAAALAARRYAAPIDVVLEIEDAFLPANAGRWQLTGSPESATCVPSSEEPDLTCDVQALGAAFLGGTALSTLAEGGQVRERRPGALAAASTAFGWHHSPSVIEVF
jgi:predicted acetyltransferase